MNAVALHLGVTAARLHRVDDDPVVANLKADGVGRRIKCRLRRGLVAHAPIKRTVVWGLGVQSLAARCQVHLGRQIVVIQHDQLGCIAGLFVFVGKDHRHRLAHIAQLACGKDGPLGRRALGFVAVFNRRALHSGVHARRFQIVIGQHQLHAGGVFGLGHVQFGDGAVRDGRPQHIGVQSAIRYDVVHVAARPGEKAHILDPYRRLTFPEFVHEYPLFA